MAVLLPVFRPDHIPLPNRTAQSGPALQAPCSDQREGTAPMTPKHRSIRILIALITGTCLLAGTTVAFAEEGHNASRGYLSRPYINQSDVRSSGQWTHGGFWNQRPGWQRRFEEPRQAPRYQPRHQPQHHGRFQPPTVRPIPAQPLPLARVRYLPLSCIDSISVGTADIFVFDSACMRERQINLRTLPAACAVRVQTRGDRVDGYDTVCLRTAGYRLVGD